MTHRLLRLVGLLVSLFAVACAEERSSTIPVSAAADRELWLADQILVTRSGRTSLLAPKPDELSLLFDSTTTTSDVDQLCAVLSLDVVGTSQVPPYYHAFRLRSSAPLDIIGPLATSSTGVICGLPVYLDPEGHPRYLHPRDILVQMSISDPGECERIIAGWGAVVSWDAWTPGMYEIRFPDKRTIFDHIRDLVHAQDLQYVEPAEWGFDDDLSDGHNKAMQQAVGAPTARGGSSVW
jgi:hypothetical protein